MLGFLPSRVSRYHGFYKKNQYVRRRAEEDTRGGIECSCVIVVFANPIY